MTKITLNAVSHFCFTVSTSEFICFRNWILLRNVIYSHDNGALLSPDALGGVFCLHVGGPTVLHDARDVLLHHVSAVIPGEREEIKMTFTAPVTAAQHLTET